MQKNEKIISFFLFLFNFLKFNLRFVLSYKFVLQLNFIQLISDWLLVYMLTNEHELINSLVSLRQFVKLNKLNFIQLVCDWLLVYVLTYKHEFNHSVAVLWVPIMAETFVIQKHLFNLVSWQSCVPRAIFC